MPMRLFDMMAKGGDGGELCGRGERFLLFVPKDPLPIHL